MTTTLNMATQYEFRLDPMSSARSRAGAPGEMFPSYSLPINDDPFDVLFVFRNGVPSFEPMNNEDKSLKPSGTKGWFCAFAIRVATSIELGCKLIRL